DRRATGSCPVTLPNDYGTYELRLFANDSFSQLAASNAIALSAQAPANTPTDTPTAGPSLTPTASATPVIATATPGPGKIVYVSSGGGQTPQDALFLVNPDGTGAHQITGTPYGNNYPR